ncbi:MAG: hypothetical protein RLY61_210 [Candidatus Parcubacteria bacterium]|jgi:hypothetical protein
MLNENKVNKNVLLVSFPFIAALAVVGDPYLFPSEPITNLGEFLLYYVLLCAILPFIALWLKHMWNAVIPAVFNTKRISFIEAFGILLISLFLLG